MQKFRMLGPLSGDVILLVNSANRDSDQVHGKLRMHAGDPLLRFVIAKDPAQAPMLVAPFTALQ